MSRFLFRWADSTGPRAGITWGLGVRPARYALAAWRAGRSSSEGMAAMLSAEKDPAVPRQLAAFTFLRLATTSMQSLQRQGSGQMIAAAIAPTYLSLAGELAGHDPEWWKQCHLQENGFLRSEDPSIAQSLRPLNDFVGWLRRDPDPPVVTALFSGSALDRCP